MHQRVAIFCIPLLFFGGCGDEKEPVLGTYDVTATLSGETCENSTSDQPVVEQVWIIAEEEGGYTLTMQDDQGNEMVVATSSDGNRFTGGGDADIFGCIFHISWQMDVSYTKKNRIDGTSTSSMSADCAADSCSEERTFEGVKRD